MDVQDFQTEVIEASHERPILVDFWAPWCGPCRVLGPVLEKLAGEAGERWSLAKVNTDEQTAVASKYGISSIPAVKLFIDGQVAKEFVGALPEPRVRQWLDEALPSPNRARIEQARAALDAGDEADADLILSDVLREEPENAEAQLLLARALVFRNPARAEELARDAAGRKPALYANSQAIEGVARLLKPGSDTSKLPEGAGRETYAAGLEALARKDLDAALTSLVDSVRRDRRYHDDAARKASVALFGLLGDKHSLTQKHRRALEMAIF